MNAGDLAIYGAVGLVATEATGITNFTGGDEESDPVRLPEINVPGAPDVQLPEINLPEQSNPFETVGPVLDMWRDMQSGINATQDAVRGTQDALRDTQDFITNTREATDQAIDQSGAGDLWDLWNRLASQETDEPTGSNANDHDPRAPEQGPMPEQFTAGDTDQRTQLGRLMGTPGTNEGGGLMGWVYDAGAATRGGYDTITGAWREGVIDPLADLDERYARTAHDNPLLNPLGWVDDPDADPDEIEDRVASYVESASLRDTYTPSGNETRTETTSQERQLFSGSSSPSRDDDDDEEPAGDNTRAAPSVDGSVLTA